MTLREFFTDHPRAALGFSGGVDSSFLLWAARSCGAEVKAYYVSTAFQPAFEREDAMRLAASLGIVPEVIELDILSCREVTANPPDRCYHCKERIFGAVAQRALEDGYTVLIDGTNASDDASDRPGMRALQELRVLSPLRMCGLTKEEIRRQSREAGLFTWNKPAYACLATRTQAGEQLTAENLRRTEEAETALHGLGFSDFRIRHRGDHAMIEVTSSQTQLLRENDRQITQILRKLGYKDVLVSPEPRKPSL
jgi:uncharacterized protein